LTNRGVERLTKKAPRQPKTKHVEDVSDDFDPAEEIRKTRAIQDGGWVYLELQFAKAIKEDGNSAEVLRLIKAFEQREDRARRVQAQVEAREGLSATEGRRSQYTGRVVESQVED